MLQMMWLNFAKWLQWPGSEQR